MMLSSTFQFQKNQKVLVIYPNNFRVSFLNAYKPAIANTDPSKHSRCN